MRTFALLVLAGCGSGANNSGNTAAAVATDVAAAPASPAVTAVMPTLEPAPALLPVALPSKPLPKGGHLPIVVPFSAGAQHAVKAGTIALTPCFKVMIPYEGIARGAGCNVAFATATLGTGAGPDVPYFTAQGLSDSSPTLDALQKELLDGLAAKAATIEASGLPYQRQQLARQGNLGTDQGRYLGARDGTMFGQPARILTWGFTQGARSIEYVDVLAMLPSGRYVSNGKPITSLLIQGYTAGYQPKLFAFSLAHFEML